LEAPGLPMRLQTIGGSTDSHEPAS